MNEREVSRPPDRSTELELAGGGGVLLRENAPLLAWKLDLEKLHKAKLLQ